MLLDLQHKYAYHSERSSCKRCRKYAGGPKFELSKTVRLNHERVSLACLVAARLEQSPSPVLSLLVFPGINARLSQVDVLELRVGIPDRFRCVFVRSNKQRRLVEPLFHSDFQPIMPNFGHAFELLDDF